MMIHSAFYPAAEAIPLSTANPACPAAAMAALSVLGSAFLYLFAFPLNDPNDLVAYVIHILV